MSKTKSVKNRIKPLVPNFLRSRITKILQNACRVDTSTPVATKHGDPLASDANRIEPGQGDIVQDTDPVAYYRLDTTTADESIAMNAQLLANLGNVEEPFLLIDTLDRVEECNWDEWPRVVKAKIRVGKVRHTSHVYAAEFICVDSLTISVHTSDGKVFRSKVCMAVNPFNKEDMWPKQVFVTWDAHALDGGEIWGHLDGFGEHYDDWKRESYEFSKLLSVFWAEVIGPDEPLRQRLAEAVDDLKGNWRSVTVLSSGAVTVHYKNGKDKVIVPPQLDSTEH